MLSGLSEVSVFILFDYDSLCFCHSRFPSIIQLVYLLHFATDSSPLYSVGWRTLNLPLTLNVGVTTTRAFDLSWYLGSQLGQATSRPQRYGRVSRDVRATRRPQHLWPDSRNLSELVAAAAKQQLQLQ